jgi:RNA polymerase sigma-70 factor, ECF subfamily
VSDDIAAGQVGDDSDFAKELESYRDRLFEKARWICGFDSSHADDLAQETMCRALRRRDQFKRGTRMWAWLVTILMNLYRDYLKHQKVACDVPPELAEAEMAAYDMAYVEVTDDDLYAAIDSLELELRDVIDCCELQGMRHREAAEKLRIPLGTVGTRLQRAKRRLKEILRVKDRKRGKP